MQMSALLSTADLEALQRRALGATQERMLRELADAVDTLTAEQPLVLVLEDLHWSDTATLDLVSYLARQRGPARLLLLGTYRPAAVVAQGHALRAVAHDLVLHGHGEELALDLFTEAEVAQYLAARFTGHEVPARLARLLHGRTDGNPLFLVTMVEHLVRQGWMATSAHRVTIPGGLELLEAAVPDSLRQLIEQQLLQCSATEQRVLEAAGVAGVEWTVAAVAAGLNGEMLEVEEQCAALAQRGQFVHPSGVEEWLDQTVTGRYRFHHALYQQVLYDRVPVGRRVHLHRQIGARQEAGYGERAGEHAAVLAVHFARGRDTARAVRYMQQAADTALGRHAYREAMAHITDALDLLHTLPKTPERLRHELTLQIMLGPAVSAVKGYVAVEQAYLRAHQLCQQVGDVLELFRVLHGLRVLYLQRAELPRAYEMGAQCLTLAQRQRDPALLEAAHQGLGTVLFWRGEFAQARTHMEAGIALHEAQRHRAPDLLYGHDPGVVCRAYLAWLLWLLGYPAQALQWSDDNLVRAQARPFSLAHALGGASSLHHYRREGRLAQEQAEALMALASEHGFPFFYARGAILRGWALAAQGQGETGIAQLHQGLAAIVATGAELGRASCLVLLAEAVGHVGQVEEGLHLLAEVLTAFETSGRGDMLAEAYRLQGEFLLRQEDVAGAEACFQQALAIARRQQAKSLELRAAMSLSRLWQQQSKRTAAHDLLAPIYGWFTEGFDTADLQEAKALLEDFGGWHEGHVLLEESRLC
jgi:predicted ATPase